jgi:hypothetical protein
VNINGNLEWWYAATYVSAIGTLTSRAANWTDPGGFLTVNFNSGTFDVSSAISSDLAWSATVVHDPENGDWTSYEPYLVTPTAAATSVITRNAFPPLPSGNIVPSADILSYLSLDAQPLASIAITGTDNVSFAMTSATPFLYFTAYEVESAANGTTATTTISLPRPSVMEYWLKGIESSVSATGTLPDDFLHQIPHSTCSPGTVQGEVTVIVVLDLYYLFRPPSNPFLVHFESTALGFETETDMVLAQETLSKAVDPKWTEDLGEMTSSNDKIRLQTEQSGPTQPANQQPTHNEPGSQQSSPRSIVGSETRNVQQPYVYLSLRRSENPHLKHFVSIAPLRYPVCISRHQYLYNKRC